MRWTRLRLEAMFTIAHVPKRNSRDSVLERRMEYMDMKSLELMSETCKQCIGLASHPELDVVD